MYLKEKKIMKMPQFVPVLHRKLKSGCTYEDFYQAWLPLGLNGKDPRKEAVGYFNCPVQVINAVNAADPTEIISIGLIWSTAEEAEKEIERTQDTEAERSEKVSKIVDKSQDAKFYIVKDVNLLGTAFPPKFENCEF
jgi:hypothetical protein